MKIIYNRFTIIIIKTYISKYMIYYLLKNNIILLNTRSSKINYLMRLTMKLLPSFLVFLRKQIKNISYNMVFSRINLTCSNHIYIINIIMITLNV